MKTCLLQAGDKFMLIIGRNPVIETLKFSPLSIKRVFILQGLTDKKIKEIIHSLNKLNIDVEFKSKKEFENLLIKKDKSEGISQGVVAEVSDYEYADLNVILEETKSKLHSVLVILDEIQDPHNLGAIIRTSAASGADALVITEKNSAKVNHTVMKTSSGAANYIKIALSKNIYTTITALKEQNFRIIGTSLAAKTSHYDYDFSGKIALIFGNEGEGLRKNVSKMCDNMIRIPINGSVESLNVSVAAGVILYEILRQKRFQK